MKTALTIAGSDSSGGAGVQADIKTFSAQGVYGMSVMTAVTAQNTLGVLGVQDITPDMIGLQLNAIFSDIHVDAVKIGMVSQTETINMITAKLKKYQPNNIVLDPVMVSKSGHDLLQPDAKQTLINSLIPFATVITPNIPEAEAISHMQILSIDDMRKVAKIIFNMGCRSVLLKGGHLDGDAVDVFYDGLDLVTLKSERIQTKNTHGKGCTLSSAIAANLAKGQSMIDSVRTSKDYITTAIKHALNLGHGHGYTSFL